PQQRSGIARADQFEHLGGADLAQLVALPRRLDDEVLHLPAVALVALPRRAGAKPGEHDVPLFQQAPRIGAVVGLAYDNPARLGASPPSPPIPATERSQP